MLPVHQHSLIREEECFYVLDFKFALRCFLNIYEWQQHKICHWQIHTILSLKCCRQQWSVYNHILLESISQSLRTIFCNRDSAKKVRTSCKKANVEAEDLRAKGYWWWMHWFCASIEVECLFVTCFWGKNLSWIY